MSGSVARITPPTAVSAPAASLKANRLVPLCATSSTRPQASHSGTSSNAKSCTVRKVNELKPLANPMLCAASATVSPNAAAVQAMKSIRAWRTQRPPSMPVTTAATSTPAKPIRTGRDISPYRARCRHTPGPRSISWLLLVPALDAGLLQQLAVLLLGHALATLLDDRAHETTPFLGICG